jgi:hypothetical protein
MAERSGVFLLQGEDSLVAMEPGQFASEDDFQRLLSRFPELLVGDQVDPQSPRRWILVKREQPISTGEIRGLVDRSCLSGSGRHTDTCRDKAAERQPDQARSRRPDARLCRKLRHLLVG